MSSLKRSLHRSVAVLLLPLGLLLIQAEVITRNLSGVVESPVPGLSRAVGIALFTGATLYLVASGLRQLAAAADTPF
ncbi:hypothetical protein HISP_01720 [Haloarcula hispanica N601]|jgi:hypothetical protein|uniref:Uncharacterized protein n=4 Tax=Haloarcula TaxID=2237 RepID=A0A495R0X1_9EURY|nr:MULTISPECIES: hypothetical protein [Haloarcula]AEM55953.1 conserved hypothetical protein [Haloarcula hispanica ATCC 33960]AHB64774.1 hypothetical protein HISP_01720 [Haloarcula hispanica N601]AJF25946.1 hypothetical protein SG26_09535 [Haloarcula sp. CBA1115]EMA19560.1 hypothetical protein C442_13625 [Haloarcula amylolytica JCM 13557]KZX49811.1 hypothetical protein AV929_14995 [Haloarcula sp. K1]